ncbi:Hypothetical predicted protein [Pelobates cultripes]|uniref:Uncharacterized protein n=1 Tax=Pelobates cultripes TaxID=61616 RepID=A0AAD1T7G9_PELCU|nr:Hypothetical predicted protein [Pelobates cultripes]
MDATRHPDFIEEQTDLLSRLNKIFDYFWQKLEDRMHQSDPVQPQVHPPPQPIAPPQQIFAALTGTKDTKWRRGGRLPSLRQQVARRRKPP